MRVLLIGYGSIGKRHEEVLLGLETVQAIDIVTKQKLNNKIYFPSLEDVDNIDKYDYFIIATETSKHYEQLRHICSKVKDKKILVEKPIFDKKYENFTCQNQIFTAYNLRFHPILQKLKSVLLDQKIYYVNVICGQYLPTWRPEQDYRKSYSADIIQGGGVLRDLSHELDYIGWLFGEIKDIKYINTQISDLEITSDDIFTGIAITSNKIIINLSIDYISKIPLRKMLIHTKDNTIEVDVITNSLKIQNKDTEITTVTLEAVDRNHTYLEMHKAILHDYLDTVCHIEEGKKVVDIINNIKFEEL